MISDMLYAHAERTPDRTFLVCEMGEYSYAAAALGVSCTARKLHAAGVQPGDRVALLCGNRPAFLFTWFAINELGAVAVPLNTGLKAEGLRYILAQGEASLLLIEREFLDALAADLDAMVSRPKHILIDESLETPPSEHLPRWQEGPVSSSLSACSILYTSGTTGLPKGAVLPHSAYEAAGHDMAHSLCLTDQDRIMTFLPLFHANPQMYAVASALHVGATLILRPRFSASAFFDDATRFRATGFTYVGTVLAILEKQYPMTRKDHSLRWAVGGGAPERVWRQIAPRFGFSICELYGMTETGGWVSMNTVPDTRVGSVGKARPGVTLAIRGEDNTPVPEGTQGEIVAQASSGIFFTEYWNNREATAATLHGGWLHTGDRGSLDAEGYLYFHGRIKELIRRNGEMIAPAEIEMQLLRHPEIRECAVVGVPDDITGEEIMAVLVSRRPLQATELREFVAARLPTYMVPRYAIFVDSLPKTETEKVKRNELVKLNAPILDLAS